MGWTQQNRSKGQSHDEFFGHLVRPYEILASTTTHTYGHATYIGVVRHPESKEISVTPFLLQWVRNDPCGNFLWKDVPAEDTNAYGTQKMIDLVDGHTDDPALMEWVEMSRRNLASATFARSATEGDKIVLSTTLTFTGNLEADTFTMRRRNTGRTRRLTPYINYQPVRLPKSIQTYGVTRIIRGDGTVEHNPNTAYKDEDAYVKDTSRAIDTLPWEQRKALLTERYGRTMHIEWALRQEYREGNRWEVPTSTQVAAK